MSFGEGAARNETFHACPHAARQPTLNGHCSTQTKHAQLRRYAAHRALNTASQCHCAGWGTNLGRELEEAGRKGRLLTSGLVCNLKGAGRRVQRTKLANLAEAAELLGEPSPFVAPLPVTLCHTAARIFPSFLSGPLLFLFWSGRSPLCVRIECVRLLPRPAIPVLVEPPARAPSHSYDSNP